MLKHKKEELSRVKAGDVRDGGALRDKQQAVSGCRRLLQENIHNLYPYNDAYNDTREHTCACAEMQTQQQYGEPDAAGGLVRSTPDIESLTQVRGAPHGSRSSSSRNAQSQPQQSAEKSSGLPRPRLNLPDSLAAEVSAGSRSFRRAQLAGCLYRGRGRWRQCRSWAFWASETQIACQCALAITQAAQARHLVWLRETGGDGQLVLLSGAGDCRLATSGLGFRQGAAFCDVVRRVLVGMQKTETM